MKKNGEKGNEARKESISSSKSGEVSESDSYQETYIPIKKETSNYQIIDNKLYDKIVLHIKNINIFQEQLKSKTILQNKNQNQKLIFDQTKFTTSLTNEFSIISNKMNKSITSEEENSNNNNLYKSSDNVIKINNPNTSMMSLFMNSNKNKVKDKEEIIRLKTELADINKKTQTEIDYYKNVIKDLSIKIETLEKELSNLKEINAKLISRQNLNKTSFELIYTNDKMLSKIISYLETNEKFNFSKCNIFLYKNIFFKAVSENLLKKIENKNYIIQKLSGEDLLTKFDVKEQEISELFRDYIINQKISGETMRNEIVKSLIFLENYVTIPLTNYKLQNSSNKKAENLFDLPQEKP